MKEEAIDIDVILEKYPGEPRYLISLLQDVQEHYQYISEENISLICDHVGVPTTQAWSVATFYKSFSLEPKGEHEIRVCLGTACHLKGGERMAQGLERHLGIERGHTTDDMRFSLESVNCLGACALAPVVMIDENYIGDASQQTVKKHLKKL